MKVFEKYSELKEKYQDYVILIKSGTFYVTFNEDGYIMHSVFNYKVINNKVGFPLNSLDKVCFTLKNKSINYIIWELDKKIIKKSFVKNDYKKYLIKSREDVDIYKKCIEINDLTNKLINENIRNYNKILGFLNEL